jgi:hypothetical protein
VDVDAPRFETLEQVLTWARAAGAEIVDSIAQDEFTIDVVLAHGGRWLVYDTT